MKKNGILIAGIAIVAGILLYIAVPAYRKPIQDLLPFAAVLLCPAMMLFGMHGAHTDKRELNKSNTNRPQCH